VKKGILTISSLLLSVALAQGGLVIQANGDQETDENGVTTLTQGGTVTDNVNGITIKGSFIKVKDGAFLNASNATIITSQAQNITASKIEWNIASDRMALSGPLNVSTNEVKSISSGFAIAYPKAGILVSPGNVTASSPVIKANSAVVDGKSREGFLSGNYVFQEKGKTKLEGQVLWIKFDNKGKVVSTKTGNSIPESVKARYLGLLGKNR
jgi:lipopolysaccharide assembly outer membrane protein LptD (OstA)